MRAVLALVTSVMFVTASHAATSTAEGYINKFNADNVGAALQKFGLRYERQKDRHGDPMLIVREGELVHENGLAVIFYGCDESGQCNTISFYTYFRTQNPLHPDIYHVWNDIFRLRTWTKVFKDSDGDTGFVLPASAIGGISIRGLEFMTGKFLEEMNNFKDSIEKVSTVSAGDPAELIARSGQHGTGSATAAAPGMTTQPIANLGAELKAPPKDALMQR